LKIPFFQLIHTLESDEQHDCIPNDMPNKHIVK